MPASQPNESPRIAPLSAPPGGVMTREVGAVTGDLETWVDPEDPETVLVRYQGAEDVYTVEGAAGGLELGEIVGRLTADPGQDQDGNPLSTDLR